MAAALIASANSTCTAWLAPLSRCNTLLGLGFGPTLVALATDHVFRDPLAVGLAMAVTILPAGILAAIFFARSGRLVEKVT